MPALHPFVADFQERNRNLLKYQQMRVELRRLVAEIKRTPSASRSKRDRKLLREAEEELER